MKSTNTWALVGVAAAVVIGTILPGCENSSTSDTVITVTPASVALSGVESATFTASSASTNNLLNLPLEWSVSDPSLGFIKASEGVSAIYSSSGRAGDNAIIVRDQAGAEGLAMAIQR